MRTQVIKLNGLILFLAAGLTISSAAHAASLIQVKQTVFGMDCAPCAHGVEKGLEQLEGVQDATVSLNEGYAAVTLAPKNSVTLQKIQQIVRENGFTPKDATVVISGTLDHSSEHQTVLLADSGEEYPLSAAPDNSTGWQTLQALPAGTDVEIKAQVGQDDPDQFLVLEVKPQA